MSLASTRSRSHASPMSATPGSTRCSTTPRVEKDLVAFFQRFAQARRHAADDRRRSFHHLCDPEGHRARRPGRAGPYRRPYRRARPDPGRALPPRLALSQRHRGRAGGSQAHGADRHPRRAQHVGSLGVLRPPRHPGDLHRGIRRARRRRDRARRARDRRRRPPPISRSTSTRSTPPSRPAPARRRPAASPCARRRGWCAACAAST